MKLDKDISKALDRLEKRYGKKFRDWHEAALLKEKEHDKEAKQINEELKKEFFGYVGMDKRLAKQELKTMINYAKSALADLDKDIDDPEKIYKCFKNQLVKAEAIIYNFKCHGAWFESSHWK